MCDARKSIVVFSSSSVVFAVGTATTCSSTRLAYDSSTSLWPTNGQPACAPNKQADIHSSTGISNIKWQLLPANHGNFYFWPPLSEATVGRCTRSIQFMLTCLLGCAESATFSGPITTEWSESKRREFATTITAATVADDDDDEMNNNICKDSLQYMKLCHFSLVVPLVVFFFLLFSIRSTWRRWWWWSNENGWTFSLATCLLSTTKSAGATNNNLFRK